MYESIDAVARSLQRKLRKYKERRIQGLHKGGAQVKDEDALQEALAEIEDIVDSEQDDDSGDGFVDPYKQEVAKIKSFQLDHAVSLDEAVFSLDYVDHDFYVFRNKETNKINVVYKLNNGGVGHVEP